MGIQRKKICGYSRIFLNSHDFNLLLQQYGFEIQEQQEPAAGDDWHVGPEASPDKRVMAKIVFSDTGEKLYQVEGEDKPMSLKDYAYYVLSYDGCLPEPENVEALMRRITEENFLIIANDVEPDEDDDPDPDDNPDNDLEPEDNPDTDNETPVRRDKPGRRGKPNLIK